MDIRTRHFHDVAILSLDGHLDSASAPQLVEAIDEQVDAGYVRLVVDLQKVDFLNSSGIKIMIQGAQVTRQQGGDFRIAHAHAQVRYVLHLAGVDTLIQMFPHVVGATVSYFPGPLPGEC